MKKIKLRNGDHRGNKCVLLDFEKDPDLIVLLRKSLPDLKWSQTKKCWYHADPKQVLDVLFSKLKGKYFIDYSELKLVKTVKPVPKTTVTGLLSESHLNDIQNFKNHLTAKRYSENTVKTYVEALTAFFKFFHDKQVADLQNDDLIHFNNEYILKNKYSASYQNQVVNAVKLFFRTVQDRKINVDLIERPRREHKLPNVLSKEEVKLILQSLTNPKHVAMLSLIYACGLRRSELLNLTLKDVHSDRKLLLIRQSKGKKDRVVPISDKIIEMLREYYKQFRPKQWLFEGQIESTQYSERSLELVLKKSITIAKITKPVTLHWLRHSYATHLMESGTDLRYIQELLGHKSSKTTEIYTHVSTKSIQQIKSPFDDL